MTGPATRTDIVDVYVFRRPPRPRGAAMFLQLLRAQTVALPGTWHPVMGHMEPGEIAAETALRELREETAYGPDAGLLGFWQLETPNTYFLHSHEAIVMSPCFAAEVARDREPVLDPTHDAARWIERAQVDRNFLWPGQRTAIGQIVRDLLEPGSAVEPVLRIDPRAPRRRGG